MDWDSDHCLSAHMGQLRPVTTGPISHRQSPTVDSECQTCLIWTVVRLL